MGTSRTDNTEAGAESRGGVRQLHHGVGYSVEHDGAASDYSRMWHFVLVVDEHHLRSLGRFTSRRRAIECARRLIDRLAAKTLAAENERLRDELRRLRDAMEDDHR